MSQRESNPSSTWFVTGASRGFGRELTEQVLARGDRVAATLRRPGQLDDLAAEYGDRLWVRALDVTDTGQMRRVVREAFADLGRIDVVVSNAGYGVFGAAEDLTDAQVEVVISTNLTAVEPRMQQIADALGRAVQDAGDIERRIAGSRVRWSSDWARSFDNELVAQLIAELDVPG